MVVTGVVSAVEHIEPENKGKGEASYASKAQVDLIGESAMVDESVAPQPLPILEANEGDVCDMKTITEMSNKEEQQEDDHTSCRGPSFTWRRGYLHQRLHRCLVNLKWLECFGEAYVQNLDRLGSDHQPLFLQLSERSQDPSNIPFRFISAWQEHQHFQCLLSSVWKCDNLREFHSKVDEWNRNTFGYIGQHKKKLYARIRSIDQALMHHHSDFLVELMGKLRSVLEEVVSGGTVLETKGVH
ncbi:hypothetical protein V6N13_103695 [Hibiscus sabdariffa]